MPDEDTNPAIVLPIEGMTCGACASRVDAALRSIPGVTEVAVDLAGARAIVRTSWRADTPRIGEAVFRAGYLPGLVSRQYLVTGMDCSTCRTTVELAIRSIRGVVRVEVNLATGRARVDASATVPASAIIGAVENAGYAAVAVAAPRSGSPGAALAAALLGACHRGRRRFRQKALSTVARIVRSAASRWRRSWGWNSSEIISRYQRCVPHLAR